MRFLCRAIKYKHKRGWNSVVVAEEDARINGFKDMSIWLRGKIKEGYGMITITVPVDEQVCQD